MKHKKINDKACVYFHQGWTDIIMCLGLINYYNSIYKEIVVIIRSDASGIVDYYIKNLVGVSILYIPTDNGRFYGQINTAYQGEEVTLHDNTILIPSTYDICFHGEHDKYRRDIYKDYWSRTDIVKQQTVHFSEAFYEYYDIDFNNRIDKFELTRNNELEQSLYHDFTAKHGKNYVLYHDDNNNSVRGNHHVDTKIDFEYVPEHTYVNLNLLSDKILDYVLILQNAKEVHFVDSIWGCAYYQLDAKCNIFDGKEVRVYCKRGHDNMFLYPKTLKNWKLMK